MRATCCRCRALPRRTGASAGASLAYGINWTRYDPRGWRSTLTFGQVIPRDRLIEVDGTTSFTNASGLQERSRTF